VDEATGRRPGPSSEKPVGLRKRRVNFNYVSQVADCMNYMAEVVVYCEPLSRVGFPANREKCREFLQLLPGNLDS
jgi:hypothetical protein